MEYPKRLGVGKIFLGPDVLGCYNSGMQPALCKSKKLKDYANLNPKGYKFIVGPRVDLHRATMAMLMGHVKGNTFQESPTEKVPNPAKTKFFKTYSSAKKFHQELVSEIEEINDRIRQERDDAKARAKSNDPETAIGGAMDLADF